MIDKNKEVQVSNRSRGVVGYVINEMGGLTRDFQRGETKTVTFEELEKLSWIPGGMSILKNDLVIRDEEVVKELLDDVEPEYYYKEDDVKYLLTTGPYEQLLDCLDFAPEGVLELVKKYAVELPCNDVAKRDAIFQKLGFNVDKAIELTKEEETEDAAPVSSRRTAPVKTASTSKYTITK